MIEGTKAEYKDLFLSLFPPGQIDTSEDSNLATFLDAPAAEFSRVHLMAMQLLEEADPRTTQMLFDEWEAFCGLPDSCSLFDETRAVRRQKFMQRLLHQGGQSRAFYKELAEALGYEIEITEYRPFICGISECVAPESTDSIYVLITKEQDRFIWDVTIKGPRLTWFTCEDGECGVDTMLTIDRASDLECLFQKMKAAHTQVNFIYEEE